MIKEITETEYNIKIKNEILTQCHNKWDQQPCHCHHLGALLHSWSVYYQSQTTITATEYCKFNK